MITVNIKKVLNGMVSLRDYIVRRCIERGTSLKVIHEGHYMVLSPTELEIRKRQLTHRLFKSKYGGPNYFLYDYQWKPNEN